MAEHAYYALDRQHPARRTMEWAELYTALKRISLARNILGIIAENRMGAPADVIEAQLERYRAALEIAIAGGIELVGKVEQDKRDFVLQVGLPATGAANAAVPA